MSTITPRKARKILRDGKVRGKPLTDKQRGFFGARASGKPMLYGNGGRILEAYQKGTHEDLWNAWEAPERTHFLIDHYDMVTSELESDVTKYGQKFSHAPWKDLPQPIRQQVAIHHAMGFYVDGGTAKPLPMKYLTPSKKQLLEKITSIKERMKDVKDEKTLASIHAILSKAEEELNAKIPTRQKIQNWKEEKAKRRMNRK